MDNLENFPKLLNLTNAIITKLPLQKKKIEKFIASRTNEELDSIEKLFSKYENYLEAEDISLETAIEAYNSMCNGMIKCQISFMKTGKYPVESTSTVFQHIYDQETQMKPYMIGLAISQFLWESHFKMYLTFKESLIQLKNKIHNYLEIGPGHGLYLQEAIARLGVNVEYTTVDISKISIDITKNIVSKLIDHSVNISFIVSDMLNLDIKKKYDFITMGEVLEHVDQPNILLEKMHQLLSDDGKAFVSTCVNCPAIDHVYHFKNIDEIREILNNNNLIIEKESINPVEDLPFEEIVKRKITINYCAIVKKRKT